MIMIHSFTNKVETVGDKYMAVSGLPNVCDTHALNIADLALDMADLAEEMNEDGTKIQVRKTPFHGG